jgi:hypothetical protein
MTLELITGAKFTCSKFDRTDFSTYLGRGRGVAGWDSNYCSAVTVVPVTRVVHCRACRKSLRFTSVSALSALLEPRRLWHMPRTHPGGPPR